MMETPLGQLVTYAILGRINNGNNDRVNYQSLRGAGFPGHRDGV